MAVLAIRLGDHRNGVIWALCSTVTAANTGGRIDVDLAVRETGDRTGWAACQAFRVLTVHTDRWYEDALDGRLIWTKRPFNMNSTPDKASLSVDLMAREGTIAAANAFGHVLDQQIFAVDNSRLYLAAYRRKYACVVRM